MNRITEPQSVVQHWKREWVRPKSLKPGQNPGFKVMKWVLSSETPEPEEVEDGLVNAQPTDEEMAAAVQVAAGARGEQEQQSTGTETVQGEGEKTGTAETAVSASRAPPSSQQDAGQQLQPAPGPDASTDIAMAEPAPPLDVVPSEGVIPVNADKPAEGAPEVPSQTTGDPASSADVMNAVKDLQTVPDKVELVGTGESADVVMGESRPFVEDEVQVAQEATQGMVGMTEPEIKQGQA